MEIKCPSCGAPHRTEDHPGAFEINCVCGYAILLPDEREFSVSAHQSADANVPIALEQEDAELLVKIDAPEENVGNIEGIDFAVDLTPPEELPKEMPYDPFEVGSLGDVPAFDNAPESDAEGMDFSLPTETPSEPAQESLSAATPTPDEKPRSVPPVAAPARRMTAQNVVDRAQTASMGQFLGSSYDIECQSLERNALVEISRRCEKILSKRPWLQTELRNRKIDLQSLVETSKIENLPEILAVEVYLAAYELGGSCQSEKRPLR